MKISYNWLKDYLNIDLQPEVVAQYLTSTGLEIEGIHPFESIRGGLKGMLIGEVVSCQKHPDAEKLTVCKVNTGGAELLNIVCGAPNVAVNQKVVVAGVGCTLYPHGKEEGMTMRKAKIRGVNSEGMICAEDELGIGPSHEGILVLDDRAIPGALASEYFNVVTDTVFEVGLTPNRTDAMSHFGVARDLAACIAYREQKEINLIPPFVKSPLESGGTRQIKIDIENPEACKRYTGITLSGVQVAPSPDWLKHRLQAIGIKPHNNIVDVTNYVLHETGHPLHAFDLDQVAGKHVIVKNLQEGTPFVTLDGNERKLASGDLMICDPEKPLCIAGVYGGIHSGVTEKTHQIFLESAWFDPISVRRTARLHGLNTDASFRFERGADPGITIFALNRAVTLLCDIAGAQVSSAMVDVGLFSAGGYSREIFLRFNRLNMLTGVEIATSDVVKILELLQFEILEHKPEGLLIRVPSFRVEVTREVDVIEEVLRIFGMDSVGIPDSIRVAFPSGNTPDYKAQLRHQLSCFLAAGGFFETWNNSLTSETYANLLADLFPEAGRVRMLNPLSQDLDVMRSSLMFGMLEAALHNINRKWEDIRMFELGATYHTNPNSTPTHPVTSRFSEIHVLSMLMTGKNTSESWAQKRIATSVYDIKSYVDELLSMTGFSTEKLTLTKDTGVQFSESGCYMEGDVVVAKFGAIHPGILKHFGIRQPVYYAELDWLHLANKHLQRKIKVTPLPKYPEVRRDLSLIIDKGVNFSAIRKIARQTDPRLVKEVLLFDVYESDQLPEGKKSYAIGVIMRDADKTLEEPEIDKVMNKMIHQLSSQLGALLR
jgi:phenylalanyl-tRNA synthetase beta chain